MVLSSSAGLVRYSASALPSASFKTPSACIAPGRDQVIQSSGVVTGASYRDGSRLGSDDGRASADIRDRLFSAWLGSPTSAGGALAPRSLSTAARSTSPAMNMV